MSKITSISLEAQIASLTLQQKNVIKELVSFPRPKPSRKTQLESTVNFFQNVISSLTELKDMKEHYSLKISIGNLYDSLNIKEVSKEQFLKVAEELINK